MSFSSVIVAGLLFFWELFKTWLIIFIAPIKNPEMLWIIIPIWLNWFFAEFFQEKKGTSLGNAITNGSVLAWVGIDWIRYTLRIMSEGDVKFALWITVMKIFLAVLVLGYGLFIIIEGIRMKSYIKVLGRVRETTYATVMFSAIVYSVADPTWRVFLAIILFSPLFYFLIELIDKYAPTPKSYEEREAGNRADAGMPPLGGL